MVLVSNIFGLNSFPVLHIDYFSQFFQFSTRTFFVCALWLNVNVNFFSFSLWTGVSAKGKIFMDEETFQKSKRWFLFPLQGTNNVVVFDLGGGTFDVSVLKIQESSSFDVLAVDGDTHLGGVDFDNILVKHCVEEFEQKHKMRLKNRPLRRLQQACERAKITLSQSEEALIDLDCIQDGLDFSLVKRPI
jgi:Hsp70 protein